MTPADVRAKVEEIRQTASWDDESHADFEVAHIQEDALYLAVLRAIARGVDNPRALARAALATRKLDFSRWYA